MKNAQTNLGQDTKFMVSSGFGCALTGRQPSRASRLNNIVDTTDISSTEVFTSMTTEGRTKVMTSGEP
jgi:hypothetical protein